MTWDSNNGILTVAATLQSQIGNYRLSVTISTQVSEDAFKGSEVPGTQDAAGSLNVVAMLMESGYLDNERYLTSAYDPSIELVLNSTLKEHEGIIRSSLRRYLITVTSNIEVTSSMKLNFGNSHPSTTASMKAFDVVQEHPTSGYLTLGTSATGTVTVEVATYNALAQFMNREYAAIT
jgi:hypothetical protein